MITTDIPRRWQELQFETARILAECGFAVEVEKVIETARGKVEIDVYGQERVQGRLFTTLCECKHWKVAVPQAVIHGFRTVVSDFGANKGYIISLAGFQSGAFSAAELTNIELVTWGEFQDAFRASWLENFFSPLLLHELDGLMTHAEPFLPVWFERLSARDQTKFLELKAEHQELGWLLQHLAMHPRTRRSWPFPTLPLGESLGGSYDMAKIPPSIKDSQGYRQILDEALNLGGSALAAFRALQARAN